MSYAPRARTQRLHESLTSSHHDVPHVGQRIERALASQQRCISPESIVDEETRLQTSCVVISHLASKAVTNMHGRPKWLSTYRWRTILHSIQPSCLIRRDSKAYTTLQNRSGPSIFIFHVYSWQGSIFGGFYRAECRRAHHAYNFKKERIRRMLSRNRSKVTGNT